MKLIHFCIILILLIPFSCTKKDCLKSAGETKKVVRELSGFDKIHIYNYFNVYLKNDTLNKVEIEAGVNIIKNIETNVSDSVLIIKDLNGCGFIKGYKDKNLYISTKTYKELIIEDGANLFSVDTLRFDNMLIRYYSEIGSCDLTLNSKHLNFGVWYGAGNFRFRGKIEELHLGMQTMSNVFAENLEAMYVTVYNNSLGDVYVNAIKKLNVTINNDGNVYYKGNPKSISLNDRIGRGKLIKL